MKCLIKLRKDYKIIKNLNNEILLLSRRLHLLGDSGMTTNVDLSDKYIYSIKFTTETRTNSLLRTNLIKWTEEQETLYFIVSNLYKKPKSYRKVSALLNQRKIKTFKGNTRGKTGNNVHSVLKRYNERKQQIEYMNKKYQTEWSRIKLCYEKREED